MSRLRPAVPWFRLAPFLPSNLVTGAGSATDNAIARFDGTSGTLLQNSSATVTDAGSVIADNILFDATVGASGADYTTVKAAVDDNKKTILIINNATETANWDPPLATTAIYIYIPKGVTWAFSTFLMSNSNPCDFFIEGQGTLSYGYTASSNKQPFQLFNTDIIVVDGITIDNNSTQAQTQFSLGIEKISNVRFELPNVDRAGFVQNGVNSRYTNIHFVGGGSSCTQCLTTFGGGNATATNIIFTGTFKSQTNPPTGTTTDNIVSLKESVLQNINVDITGSGNFAFEVCSLNNLVLGQNTTSIVIESNLGFTMMNNIVNPDAIPVLIFLNGNDYLSNIDCGTNGIIDVQNSDQNVGTNIRVLGTGTIDLTDAGCTNNKFTNCRIAAAQSIGGDRNELTNCDFLGGVTVVSGANDNGFVNCQFGADAGGGALTITVNSGSNRTRIVGCMSDAAISDAGTGTVVAGNTVY